jgi:dienelactone hydrolase
MRYLLLLCCYLFSSSLLAQDIPQDMHESEISIDVKVKDRYANEETGKVVITEYKPDGNGPFPIVVINHGRGTDRVNPPQFLYIEQARFFLRRGFAVFVPTRIGYGKMGTTFDPEDSGSCNNRSYEVTAAAASTEILAALAYAEQQPYVDPKRAILVGVSVGGYATTASAAQNPPGLIAAINFSGGAGGDPVAHPGVPCQGNRLEDMYARFGATTKVPMLWLYAENDLFFNPTYSQAWHDAFVKAGGNAEFHLLPPFGKNGHLVFGKGMDVWSPIVGQFLDKLGFPELAAAH